jgi:hypothetical protein
VVDVKSALARFGLITLPPQPDPINEIEYLAWFRFPVTWAYLSGPSAQVKPVIPLRPMAQLQPPAITLISNVSAPPVHAPKVLETGVVAVDSRSASSTAQWEMVIPKMVRPPAKPAAIRTPVAPASLATPPPATASANPVPVRGGAAKSALAQSAAPSLQLFTTDEEFLARYWRQIAVAVLALGAIVYLLSGNSSTAVSSTRPRAAAAPTVGGWSRVSISPPGRLMSVYGPSRDESDYRLEFAWVPDAKGVGWVFRTRDADDYYATRLTLLQPGANLVLAAEHFSVSAGRESAHARKVIPLANNSGLVRVRMDAIGPAFALSLQDSPVDYWTDPRLDSGALGFYEERGQRPEVQAVRFTFIQKGASHTTVASLP